MTDVDDMAAFRNRLTRLASKGWIPDQHGAWFITLTPLLTGMLLGVPHPSHGWLVAAWVSGFHFFSAVELLAKTPRRRRPTVRPAVWTWFTLSCLLGAGLLWAAPSVLLWTPLFAPLVALTFWQLWRRHDRSLVTRSATILASCLTTVVAFGLGAHWRSLDGLFHAGVDQALWQVLWGPDRLATWTLHTGLFIDAKPTGWAHAWVASFVLAAYFLGTVFLVRSLIRGRRDARWVWATIGWHLVTGAGIAWAVAVGTLHWAMLLVWVGLALRGGLLPWWQSTHSPIRPIHIGLAEIAWTFAVGSLLIVS
ncbi:YwiC-like family protein [Schaalia sp. 19OD2882]|uniref:YwiC-like family protein n=1 Tax=Schaalia sp. 19OD2882 TaxID=2794089 RepID=UPI001C1EEDFD|nr:YwiC-like family protein [Schaalia sp. 19OD2882]QWW19705.1 YwiC-like family protein [Schaalia sp. 19OD2882]